MSLPGIVTFLTDSEKGVRIGHEWMADLAHLKGAPNHLLLRAPISANSHTNKVLMDPLIAGMQLCKDTDFKMIPVLHGGMDHSYTLPGKGPEDYPNAVLGFKGFATLNAYIDAYCASCVSTLNALGDLCPDTVYIWNEPNLFACDIQPGDHTPPSRDDVAGGKTSALAPEVFLSLLYHAAYRIREQVTDAHGKPRVKHIWPGTFSLLLKFKTDPKSDWVLGYYERGLQFLASQGIVAPYPWEGMGLNCEGLIDVGGGAYVASALRDFMARWGITGPLTIGEWSVPASRIVESDMRTTYHEIDTNFDYHFFFQMPTYKPGDPGSYGCTTWGISKDGFYVPTGHTAWYELLKKLYAGK